MKIIFSAQSNSDISNPPGYQTKKGSLTANKKSEVSTELKIKKAWEAAIAPSKSIFMTLFMLWMSGNSVQIFSIIITAMTLMNPIKGIIGLNSYFQAFNDIPKFALMKSKMAFVLIQVLILACGIYKCSSMGLLPTSSSDWLAFIPRRHYQEMNVGGFGF